LNHRAYFAKCDQEFVLKNTKTLSLPSTGSIFLPDGEAAVATCGSSKQYLVRHARISRDELGDSKRAGGPGTSKSEVNIVFLFLDSMSRRHFFRTLPKVFFPHVC
jgi:hypothetical protein